MPPTEHLYVHTHTAEELIEVTEVEYTDDTGLNHPYKAATDACINIQPTCKDQGADLWSWLRDQIETRLRGAQIPYSTIEIDREPL